jgi:hypothetical protein
MYDAIRIDLEAMDETTLSKFRLCVMVVLIIRFALKYEEKSKQAKESAKYQVWNMGTLKYKKHSQYNFQKSMI